jgi:hypothetical protein
MIALAGCSAAPQMRDGVEMLTGFDPPGAPENGMQIVIPIMRDIQPGSDNEVCTWTSMIADRDLTLRAVQGFQTETGHHIVVYKTKDHQPPGTRRNCTNDDLTTVRFVAGAGGEGVYDKNEAPGNLAFTIEKGYQVIVNEHFLNASTHVHDAQSAVNLYFTEPGKTYIKSGALAIVDTSIILPPGRPSKEIDCEITQEFKAWFSIPHMHAWGTNIKVDHTSGGATKRLFDTDWTPGFTFHPPELRVDPATPTMFKVGDRIKVRCEWNNDTGAPLGFGPEMCVFFSQTVDDTGLGNWACDNGEWAGF